MSIKFKYASWTDEELRTLHAADLTDEEFHELCDEYDRRILAKQEELKGVYKEVIAGYDRVIEKQRERIDAQRKLLDATIVEGLVKLGLA